METLCKYFLAPVVVTFVLIGLFESVNPPSWPKGAIAGELFACWLVIAAIGGHNMVKEEERQRQEAKRREEEAAKTEMDKFHAELRSKEQIELEKHRLTLEAQRPKQEVVS
jgi:hypothetical protein